jgi:hypothetical protein
MDPSWAAGNVTDAALEQTFVAWSYLDLEKAYDALCDDVYLPQPLRELGECIGAPYAARRDGDERLARLWELWGCEIDLIIREMRRRLRPR